MYNYIRELLLVITFNKYGILLSISKDNLLIGGELSAHLDNSITFSELNFKAVNVAPSVKWFNHYKVLEPIEYCPEPMIAENRKNYLCPSARPIKKRFIEGFYRVLFLI